MNVILVCSSYIIGDSDQTLQWRIIPNLRSEIFLRPFRSAHSGITKMEISGHNAFPRTNPKMTMQVLIERGSSFP